MFSHKTSESVVQTRQLIVVDNKRFQIFQRATRKNVHIISDISQFRKTHVIESGIALNRFWREEIKKIIKC